VLLASIGDVTFWAGSVAVLIMVMIAVVARDELKRIRQAKKRDWH
jgi:hypothetical protein